MIKRVLIPVDFSDTSLQALDYATRFTKSFKPELVVLFVVEPVYYAASAPLYGPPANVSMLLDEQRQIAHQQLERLVKALQKRRLKARSLIQTGTPHQAIVDIAKRVKADLIVMATHGRSGFSHVLMGSVAERVVRRAACPVLTVRCSARPAPRRRTVRKRKSS